MDVTLEDIFSGHDRRQEVSDMLAIWKKEVQAYYLSPIAYVFTGVFMLVSGLFFTLSNILSHNASFIGTPAA